MLSHELEKLDKQIKQTEQKLNRPLTSPTSFGTALKSVVNFLANPYQLWQSGKVDDQRAVLRLIFADKIKYNRQNGFGTVPKSLPFRLLELNDNEKEGWCTREDSNLQPSPSEGDALSS